MTGGCIVGIMECIPRQSPRSVHCTLSSSTNTKLRRKNQFRFVKNAKVSISSSMQSVVCP